MYPEEVDSGPVLTAASAQLRYSEVDVWGNLGGLAGVETVLEELPDADVDGPAGVTEASDLPIAVEKVAGADCLVLRLL